jgi:hypothetical protein
MERDGGPVSMVAKDAKKEGDNNDFTRPSQTQPVWCEVFSIS